MVPSRGNGFGFRMDIKVHIDDKQALDYINQTLGIGNVYVNNKTFSVLFTVISRAELLIILSIFSKYNLNTTKFLDFLAFARRRRFPTLTPVGVRARKLKLFYEPCVFFFSFYIYKYI